MHGERRGQGRDQQGSPSSPLLSGHLQSYLVICPWITTQTHHNNRYSSEVIYSDKVQTRHTCITSSVPSPSQPRQHHSALVNDLQPWAAITKLSNDRRMKKERRGGQWDGQWEAAQGNKKTEGCWNIHNGVEWCWRWRMSRLPAMVPRSDPAHSSCQSNSQSGSP